MMIGDFTIYDELTDCEREELGKLERFLDELFDVAARRRVVQQTAAALLELDEEERTTQLAKAGVDYYERLGRERGDIPPTIRQEIARSFIRVVEREIETTRAISDGRFGYA